ncbi:MAG: uroporphyrinogen-III C-methyltransferase [Acidobacteria bacterium]|nr:uroporphyrinogen-III C-methyltransferase [Acidobacteriota bacterium]
MKRPAVYVIGAGPGDPRLITVFGLECLRAADVVVYDHLVPPRLLKHARPEAELIDVGTAAPQEMAQEAISYLLAEKAREGKLVARLKWGDPFVFDRGGEEALFLHEQAVPFEIVPGIPAGIAVPAYAGVPVTYPGGGDTITLVRGYEDASRTPPNVHWASLARLEGTVVCYAGAQQLPRVLDALVANGWPADGQAVIVYDGTLPSQDTVSGTLSELIDAVRQHPRRAPAILVVGRVAGFREHLRWFDTRPLFGKRVLVTRPRDQAAELVDRLSALGADAVEAPMIRIAPPDDPGPLQEAAADPGAFDWIVFTSANAVSSFMDALLDGERDLRALKGPRLCTVGPATAEKLRAYGIKVDLVPEEFRAEAVVSALAARGRLAGARVLLPRADIGRDVIADELRQAGATVTDVVAYRTVLEDTQREDEPDVYGQLLEGRIDVVTFTSASAVRNLAKIYGAEQAADLLRKTVVAVIGPVTADAARQLGIPVTIQPASYTVPALVDAIAAYYQAASTTNRQ